MKNFKAFIATICLFILLLTADACSSNPVSGEVVDKTYIPATEKSAPTITYSGGEITSQMQTVQIPEKFKICIKSEDNKTHWVEIDKMRYDTIKIGNHITIY